MLNLSSLNPQQRLAVETIEGPVLIIAGAGTGKTRVITSRVAYLVQCGIRPGNILAVTFTNKAAREMQERIGALLPRKAKQVAREVSAGLVVPARADRPTICTFHSLCVRILRHHIEKLGYKRNFVIYDESEQLGAVKKILAHISNPNRGGEKIDAAAVLALLSRVRNGGRFSAMGVEEPARAMAEHIRSRYESALRACNAVDFDDLILLTLRLFKEHPEALAACRSKYGYVMVDEYQDTNGAQFELVQALTGEHRNLCVVGDDDQSIYGWRGAEIANLLEMEKHFPGVKVIKLEQNYRSTTTILRAANAIIQHNVRRRGKNLWSQKGAGEKILLRTFSDDEEEARGIVEEVEYLRLAQRVAWSEQAILFRTNLQSRPLETALRKAGVRYRLIGGQSFFDRREVRDFLAYLKTFVNPHDDVNLLRIANVPARGLSDSIMERLLGLSQERQCSVFAVMKNPAVAATLPPKSRPSIERFVTFIERTAGSLGNSRATEDQMHAPPDQEPAISLRAWASHFMEETRYFEELRRSEKDPKNGENRVRNLKDLIDTLDSGVAPSGEPPVPPDAPLGTPRPSLLDQLQTFLEQITLDTEREEDDAEPGEAVTLITMHSCKGLEFPVVYIVGLENGLLPHSRSKLEGTLDEERRLFYVAVTRAMRQLTISHCAARKKYGALTPCHPSPFLSELPPELVEHADEKGKTPVTPESGKNFFSTLRESIG